MNWYSILFTVRIVPKTMYKKWKFVVRSERLNRFRYVPQYDSSFHTKTKKENSSSPAKRKETNTTSQNSPSNFIRFDLILWLKAQVHYKNIWTERNETNGRLRLCADFLIRIVIFGYRCGRTINVLHVSFYLFFRFFFARCGNSFEFYFRKMRKIKAIKKRKPFWLSKFLREIFVSLFIRLFEFTDLI